MKTQQGVYVRLLCYLQWYWFNLTLLKIIFIPYNTDEAKHKIITCTLPVCSIQNPAKASEATVKETSTPETLTAAQVSISITIVANLTNEVLNNSEVAVICNHVVHTQLTYFLPTKVRQNYLQAIDNIQQAPAEVVLESQVQTSSSSRCI